MTHVRYNDDVAADPSASRRDFVAELGDALRELGVAEELIPDGEARVYLLALRFAAERFRDLIDSLPNDPRSRALKIAVLGTGGRSYQEHADETDCAKGNLHRGVKRMRAHLARTERAELSSRATQ